MGKHKKENRRPEWYIGNKKSTSGNGNDIKMQLPIPLKYQVHGIHNGRDIN